MIFFCKISPFLPTRRLARSLKTATSCFLYALPHPDRRDVLLKYWLFKSALWVAPSANAKNFNISQRKNSYDGSYLIWV